MTDNLALWNRAFITDPAAVKEITGKQYRGNSPKPYWIVQRLTEEFGPVGIGWGFTILTERMEHLTPAEVLHIACVRFWYVLDGKRGELEQIGQTKAMYTTNAGKTMIDEDAPKKSVTDALVKCASYLGFAGDIFSGLWDDSKYVESAREHYKVKADPALAARIARETELNDLAMYLVDLGRDGKELEAARAFYALENDEDAVDAMKYVWGLLKTDSKLRSGIQANKELVPRKHLKETSPAHAG
jgi:hypothetical protein